MTGFSLVPGHAAADLASPTNAHIRLLAQQQQAQPAASAEAPLRSAIVNVAHYYLRMAQSKSPSEMEAVIWQHASADGVDHGPSCAAFASLTLEQAAQVVGQQSWVTGGTSYPWPLHPWVDARVDPNPASLGITSIVQDAQAHHRWHPLGDGYQPLPGDWVLFDGHVEVVTSDSGGVLRTIGGDSLPDFSVNAHEYPDPLSAQGVTGFVNNGALAAGASKTGHSHTRVAAARTAHHHHPAPGQAAIPGAPAPDSAGHGAGRAGHGADRAAHRPAGPAAPPAGGRTGASGAAEHRPGRSAPEHISRDAGTPRQGTLDDAAAPDVPGAGAGASGLVATLPAARRGAASIPGLLTNVHRPSSGGSWASGSHYRRHQPPSATPAMSVSQDQQAFIRAVAKGALATQRKYGIPASVTIAQAIDESGWGQSYLATKDHNLFGIKGSGPAGSDMQPTQEVVNGQAVSQIASFRVYHSIAQSIEDHGRLLAGGGPYAQSMTLIHDPNAFASSLTGVYATDPSYGAKLISLMQRYHLYRYDSAASNPAPRSTGPAGTQRTTAPRTPTSSADIPGAPAPAPKPKPPRPRAAHTPAPTWPTPAPSAPTSPAPNSPAPASPEPTSPVTTSPVPTSSPPASPAPSSPAATSPQRGSPAPGAAVPDGAGRTGAGAKASKAKAGAPAASARARAPGQAARRAATPQAPDIPGVSQPTGLRSPGATPDSQGAAQGQGTRLHPRRSAAGMTATTQAWSARRMPGPARHHARAGAAHTTVLVASTYQTHLPPSVSNDFTTMARGPLTQAEPLYRDIAGQAGVGWQLLAACDWMQCQAQPRLSPVHGEKLGTVNSDGTAYHTKSAALEQCAHDLIQLARAVYGVDLTGVGHLSVRDLANVFAAFRWGALLKVHHTSAMEFPYSVAGLTVQHANMRWPKIAEHNAPDKPGARFRMPFGAVPVMLSLNYPATV
jgi:Mannosyl-glycoprotein endo-beta-N-acetylglucosaminidase